MITGLLPKTVTITTASIAPIRLPIALSEIVLMERKTLGCIAITALTAAIAFNPASSGNREAINKASIIAIPVFRMRAPNFKCTAPSYI